MADPNQPDPVKPLDRNKPFKRINNDSFRPKNQPDGDGVARGCHIPADFKNREKEFEKFLEDNVPIVGPLLKALEFLKTVTSPSALAKLLLDSLGDGVPELLKQLLEAAAAGLGAIAAPILVPINAIISAVSKAVETAIKAFVTVLGRRILGRAIRVIPQWVPVLQDASNDSVTSDQVIEVEGLCSRSFGNPIDVPFFNWHQWFAWNVQVQPEPEYANVLSPASDPPNTTGMASDEQPVTKSGAFEIQWDAGALEDSAGRVAHTLDFPDTQMPLHDGPMIINSPFLWPMAGMFVWASGRHVYDCSRVSDQSANPKMCAIINPARALATARWTAANFIENGNFSVPAIQFMFIASKRGGYINHDAAADSDYEFIVDLPPIDQDISPFPIGSTENFPHNTIALRPRLLKDLRILPGIDSSAGEPIVEPIRPDDPSKPPSQVKVTIPQGVATASDAYGFVLSMGWFDPGQVQAKTVKACKLTINRVRMRLTDRDAPAKKLRQIFKQEEDQLKQKIKEELDKITVKLPIIGDIHPFQLKPIGPFLEDQAIKAVEKAVDVLVDLVPGEAEEEWLLRIGVNGIWTSHFFAPHEPPANEAFFEDLSFDVQLAAGDPLFFAAHGAEFDPVGDIMHSSFSNRVLTSRKTKAQVPWAKIVKPDSEDDRRDLIFDYSLKCMIDTTGGVGKMALGFDNSPLGWIDPDASTSGPSQQNNPTIVNDNFDSLAVQRLAHFARAEGDQMILFESTGDTATGFPEKPDYDIRGTLEIKDLIPRDNPPPT